MAVKCLKSGRINTFGDICNALYIRLMKAFEYSCTVAIVPGHYDLQYSTKSFERTCCSSIQSRERNINSISTTLP